MKWELGTVQKPSPPKSLRMITRLTLNKKGANMASLLDQLGINKAEFEEIKPETGEDGGFLKESGVYDAAVEEAYIRKTDSGANMLEVNFILGDGSKFNWSTCVLSGDEKGNKSTYTSKQNKEVPLPGVTSMNHFLGAIGVPDPSATKGEVKHRDNTITALCLTGVQGKKLKLGINQYENEYNGEVNLRNDIKYWMTANGENSTGDGILEKVAASLEKNPVKRLKKSATAPAATASTGDMAAAGWA